MRAVIALLIICAALAAAQTPNANATPSWRRNLSSLPATPPPNTSAQDVVQFERNMRAAATYLGNTAPNANAAQWEANRALVRRMATYLYGLRVLSGNGQLRGPIDRAQRSFDMLGFAPYISYIDNTQAPNPDAPPPTEQRDVQQLTPPFALEAPDSTGVSDTDKETAANLRSRYEADAAHSAGIWQNAETLRQNLEMRGLGLNLSTATGMMRLPQYFKSAANSLRRNAWDDARAHLEQAEAETEKMAKTVGH